MTTVPDPDENAADPNTPNPAKPLLRGWLHTAAIPLALIGGIWLILAAPTTPEGGLRRIPRLGTDAVWHERHLPPGPMVARQDRRAPQDGPHQHLHFHRRHLYPLVSSSFDWGIADQSPSGHLDVRRARGVVSGLLARRASLALYHAIYRHGLGSSRLATAILERWRATGRWAGSCWRRGLLAGRPSIRPKTAKSVAEILRFSRDLSHRHSVGRDLPLRRHRAGDLEGCRCGRETTVMTQVVSTSNMVWLAALGLRNC